MGITKFLEKWIPKKIPSVSPDARARWRCASSGAAAGTNGRTSWIRLGRGTRREPEVVHEGWFWFPFFNDEEAIFTPQNALQALAMSEKHVHRIQPKCYTPHKRGKATEGRSGKCVRWNSRLSFWVHFATKSFLMGLLPFPEKELNSHHAEAKKAANTCHWD